VRTNAANGTPLPGIWCLRHRAAAHARSCRRQATPWSPVP